MRVIAGTAGGRRLQGPRGRSSTTRPTSDLVKGAIFDVLAAMDADLERVLDLYAGSGGLGIEALSRGAGHCDFVERDAAACSVIRANLAATGFEGSGRVVHSPVEKALDRLEGPYTLVLADPPYEDAGAMRAIEAIAESSVVNAGATILVVEHSSRDEPAGVLGPFSLMRSRRHGDTAVSIYR
jgi:16S rRNA (guanine966-N2)-methyltransferase